MQIKFKFVRIFVKIRGKHGKRNGETAKIGIRTPLKLYVYCQQASSRPPFRAVRKVLRKMVNNCVRNRSRPEEIDTDTEICTSLKSEFYFRFRWPRSTKSTLISYTLLRVSVTIRGKICPPQSRNWKIGILHTSKNEYLFPVCHRNNSWLADHISLPHAKFCDIR